VVISNKKLSFIFRSPNLQWYVSTITFVQDKLWTIPGNAFSYTQSLTVLALQCRTVQVGF